MNDNKYIADMFNPRPSTNAYTLSRKQKKQKMDIFCNKQFL